MSIEHDTLAIIGGTSGIGLATARCASSAGANVIITGRNRDRLDKALKELGGGVRGEIVDASERAALDIFFSGVKSFHHLVIAASGGSGAGPFAQLSKDKLQAGFDAKFWVQWQSAQAALPYLDRRGSLTFVTAASSRVGHPNTSGLAAINGAVAAMILPLAHELGPIRVNAVSPGVIDTPWWEKQPKNIKNQFFDQTSKTVPLGRVGQAEDVAGAILFLAGNRYVTGIVLDVDGGLRGASPS